MVTMDVTYIFRSRIPGTYSIEGVFEPIARQNPGSKFVYVPLIGNTLSNIIKNIRYCRAKQGRINHVTGDVHYVMLGLRSTNYNILTIHDCGVLMDQGRSIWKRWLIKKLWFTWPVLKADVVTTVSAKSKAEIIRYTHCPESKVIVIPNYVHSVFTTQSKPSLKSLPRCLHIGSTKNKNLPRVIEALSGLECELRIIGIVSTEDEVKLKESGILYSSIQDLSIEQMKLEYLESDIVLFVSTYEGFGIPILEAQASGRPVITSDISPCKEIAGSGSICVDPFDVAQIRRAVLQLLQNETLRHQTVQAGLINVQQYGMDRIAKAYQDIYERGMRETAKHHS